MPQKAKDFQEKVRHFQRVLYHAAKRSPKRRFHALYDKIHRSDVLERAWHEVRRNRGASGIDGQTLDWIQEEYGVENFLQGLQKELAEGKYRPLPVKRVEIPKAKGGTRPLGIPTIRDRVVQAACRMVIEPIFEADFLDSSYGFRPKRSAHQAHFAIIDRIHRKGQNWVIDGDIEKYFDSIEHWKLMWLLRLRISDRRILKLIRGWLKAGVMKEGRIEPILEGTPQGGVISPLLSNVYLHFFDREWQKYAHLGTLIRYADDFVILFKVSTNAKKSLEIVRGILKRLGLRLHPEKTRLVNLYPGKDGMDFLGFYFRKHSGLPGKVKRHVVTWPSKDAMKRIRGKIKDLTDLRRTSPMSLEAVVERLNPVIRGWVNYFRVAANSAVKFVALDWYVTKRLGKIRRKKHRITRRSWSSRDYQRLGVFQTKDKVDWDLILKANGTEVVGKPDEGKPHVRFDEGVLETGLN